MVTENWVHKNRGLTLDGIPVIRLTRVGIGTTYSPKKRIAKVGPVDHHIVDIPRDACVARIDNWRKLLCAQNKEPGDAGMPRRIRLAYDGDQLLLAALWVDEHDPQEWDTEPEGWTGQGWVPFYASFRPLGDSGDAESA